MNATVKVRLHSTELVQSHKACFNRTYNVHVPYICKVWKFLLAPTSSVTDLDVLPSPTSNMIYLFITHPSPLLSHGVIVSLLARTLLLGF